ncbi:magnesium transporter CorA family protein [Nitratiruptor sp. SB155-2]|uniref:magnesium transporter CorA family protein n=1 Tax=Nitratiruptor sp. (strain SB155-2) TaxID=387092 RepID=UPI00015873BC|nr:magnesium transporter CorA family protein [Nitratiruptor sp. SB155-2]BAF70755.1 divalent cation transporter [Nitratiruptor sp. SB155-2]
MYVISDELEKKEQIELEENKKQIVFTSSHNQKIIDWLLNHGFHESFIEDIQNEDQSVAFEEGDLFRFIVLKYFKRSDEHPLMYEDANIMIILTGQKLIFLCEDREIIQRVVARFRKRYRIGDRLEYATYILLDILIDFKMNIIDLIDDRLELIEDKIFSEDVDEKEIQKSLYFARRSLNKISKISVLENDVINKIYNHFPPTIRKKLKYEFIDLKEHLSFLINESKAYLDRTGYLQNLLMGFMSNQMNKTMQRLTGITLIFLPLTFIVGNYGMNFRYMPELSWKYGYFVVWVVNILIAAGIYWWLRKKKWI